MLISFEPLPAPYTATGLQIEVSIWGQLWAVFLGLLLEFRSCKRLVSAAFVSACLVVFSNVDIDSTRPVFVTVAAGSFLLCFPGFWVNTEGRHRSSEQLKMRPMEREIRLLYRKFNPSKLHQVDALLQKYEGREEELRDRVVARYQAGTSATSPGFSPPPTMRIPTAPLSAL